MQKITIQGIESKMTTTNNTKTILVCQEGKFYFYRNTKTGISKAQEQFNKFGFKIGDIVEVEVTTEQKTFTNPAGKEITYSDNWIKFFGEVEHIPLVESPITPLKSSESVSEGEAIHSMLQAHESRIEAMAKWAKNIEKRLQGLETLEVAKNPEAVEFHQSFNAVNEKEPKFKFDLGKVKEELNQPLNIQPPEGL